MSPAGAPLVNALLRAARHYAAQGRRVHLARQEHTPGRTTAHADLIGGVDGRSVALEAKMAAGDYFPLVPGRVAQRKALQLLHEQGADVSLIVEFTDYGEAYVVAWAHVQEFLNAAWRRSLTRDWCKVHGFRLPTAGFEFNSTYRVMFLDSYSYDKGGAFSRVAADCDGKPTFKIDGDLAHDEARDRRLTSKQRALQTRMETRPKPGTPEYKDYVIKLAEEGMGRALGTGAAKAQRTKRRGWAGGR